MAESIKTISQLVENDAIFQCKGYSEIVVAYRDKDDNGNPCTKSKVVRVPIKTAGVLEFQEQIASEAPAPPVTRRMVKAGTDEAASFGYEQDTELITFDTTDQTYVDALDRHTKDFIWRVAVFAIDVEWKLKGGTADSYEKKKQILQSSGISGPQLDKIYKDIIGLAQFREDREAFLSEDTSDTPKQ